MNVMKSQKAPAASGLSSQHANITRVARVVVISMTVITARPAQGVACCEHSLYNSQGGQGGGHQDYCDDRQACKSGLCREHQY